MSLTRLLAALTAAALVLSVACAAAATIPRSDPEEVDLSRIVLTDAQGGELALDEVLPDGPVALHFWATWCVPCRDELPAIDRFVTALTENGIAERLIVVSVDSLAYERVMEFVRDDLGLQSLTTWQEITRKAGPTFRLFGYPDTVLLDADHNMVARLPGTLDWDAPGTRAQLIDHLTMSVD
jgi:thiol-disulfide isomerase/thioredoxin